MYEYTYKECSNNILDIQIAIKENKQSSQIYLSFVNISYTFIHTARREYNTASDGGAPQHICIKLCIHIYI